MNLKENKKLIIILGVIIALILITGICIIAISKISNTTKSKSTSQTLEQRVSSVVEAYVITQLRLEYDGTPSVNCQTVKLYGPTAIVYGKATIRDNYGDTYTGNFKTTVRISDEGSIRVQDTDIDKLYKDK